jgi:uncharacterized damage-inducible protein DinB
MSEVSSLVDQLRRAFGGDAWHGDSVLEVLKDVDAATAAAHPIGGVHSIWELVLHIAAWDNAVLRRFTGDGEIELSDEENFPAVKDTSEAAWKQAVEAMKAAHAELLRGMEKFPEARLDEQVQGRDHNFRHTFYGVLQHEIYHAGQMSLLKKAASANAGG